MVIFNSYVSLPEGIVQVHVESCRLIEQPTASQEWSEALRRAAFERRPGLAVALERAMDHPHMYKMGF